MNIEFDRLMNLIGSELNNTLKIKTIVINRGGPLEPLQRIESNPYIIFEHSDTSLKLMKDILINMGCNMRNINEFIRSIFDKKTTELRWMFVIPPKLYKLNTDQDYYDLWTKFYHAIYNVSSKMKN